MNRQDVITIAGEYGLSPNRKFGQNFLISDRAAERIISLVEKGPHRRIMEIGPGLGALTGRLLELSEELTAVEIDAGICRYLGDAYSGRPGFELIHGDFLKIETGGDFDAVVSNLPYYCSSEILMKLATDYRTGPVYVMLQKEVAERIVAKPGSRVYGAITVALGLYFMPEICFSVPGSSFYPSPDVSSSFIRLERREDMLLHETRSIEFFHLLLKSAFWGRRKTILRALTGSPHLWLDRHGAASLLEEAGIRPDVRGEGLGLDEYVIMAKTLDRITGTGDRD